MNFARRRAILTYQTDVMRKPFNDLAGRKFGRLTVLWPEGRKWKTAVIWLCACECGAIRHVAGQSLLAKLTLSCGCYHQDRITTHGRTYTSEYGAYKQAKQRCINPQCAWWPEYGGRGIQFKFQSFEEFFAELGPKPGREYSLDRINNDGHYQPGNVRWATRKQQANNQRRPNRRT